MSNFFKAIKSRRSVVKKTQQYRLYYDKKTGKPLFYSMELLDKDFVVVDREIYSQANLNVYVKNGVLITRVFRDISKLTQHGNETTCHVGDISIITDNGVAWSLRHNNE